MNGKFRDVLKTVGAIIIIGGIIVATFLYGNKQRQDQLRRDQEIQKTQQQQQQAANQTSQEKQATQQPANGNPQPAPTGTAAVNGTAQQSGGTNPAAQAGNVSQPQVQTPATTPATGGSLAGFLPAGLVLLLWRYLRRSQRQLQQAHLGF